MCGIAGILSYKSERVSPAEILAIRESMANRGPDSAGLWFNGDKRIALAHRRLSIIDLSASAAQPMLDAACGHCIVFNGEIYNFKELRGDLAAKGYRFKSNSDTEVILHLYAEYGFEMLGKLRGMYAIAIWDEKRKGLFLARDPFGIKPLYFSDDGRSFRFASQVKALMRGGAISNSPDPAGHVGFFLWGYVPEPHTLYKAVKSLRAGTYLWVDGKGSSPEKIFCSIPDLIALSVSAQGQVPCSSGDIKAYFEDTVSRHLVSDVPVGVFLSSGIDSSAIAAVAANGRGKEIHTITLGFNDFRGTKHDETPIAEETARRLGTSHHTSWISFKEFQKELVRLLDVMDQPSVDGMNTYFVSKAAHDAGLKVALSGLGGDEIFGGYSGFKQIPLLTSLLKVFRHAPAFSRFSRNLSAPLLKLFTSPKYASTFEYGHSVPEAYLLRRALFMPWEAESFLDHDFMHEGLEKLSTISNLRKVSERIPGKHFKVMALEMDWYMKNQLLRDADWAGMAHNLEIRVPFVDEVFLRNILSHGPENPFLRKSEFAGALGELLSPEVVKRPKKCFSMPIHKWLNEIGDTNFTGRNVRGWGHFVHEKSPAAKPGELLHTGALLNKNKVLVHRIGLLGDTIVALPAFSAIRQHFVNSHISVLFDDRPGQVTPRDILRHTDLVDSYIPYSRQDGAFAFIKLLRALRLNHYETLVYLAPSGRSRFQFLRDRTLFRLAGIKNMVGVNYRAFANHELEGSFHETDFLLHTLRACGIAAPAQALDLSVIRIGVEKIASCENKLGQKAHDWRNRRLLAFAPGSNIQAKRWSFGKFVELGKLLIDNYSVLPVVFGSQKEKELGDSLVNQWGGGINLAGATDIIESFAALQKCCAYVGNDTGTMHMAALAGLKCVGVFSARNKGQNWYPYGPGHIVLREIVPCAGCNLEVCPKKIKCVNLVPVEAVFNACVTTLGINDK